MLYLTVDDGGIIRDAAFQGSGCAISVASASIMTDMLKGKTLPEANTLVRYMHAACTGADVPSRERKRGRCRTDAGARGRAALSHSREMRDAGMAHNASGAEKQQRFRPNERSNTTTASRYYGGTGNKKGAIYGGRRRFGEFSREIVEMHVVRMGEGAG